MDAQTPIPDLHSPAVIRIQQEIHPKVSRRSESESRFRPLQPTDTTGLAGGIFNTRALSRGATHRSGSRAPSDRHIEAGHDGEEGDNWMDSEKPKSKQIYSGKTLLWLSYQSIGAIYGDIGTSPLYVYSSTFSSAPSHEAIVQVLSLILWSLTIMVTFKYILIVLRADNEGEGGTFSCYSLLTRYVSLSKTVVLDDIPLLTDIHQANITERDPREQQLVHMERHLTGNLRPSNLGIRNALEKNKFFRGLLKTIGVLAVSMVLSDGVLTPAQSVLGAVQGLNVVKPDISSSTVVGTSCGIIVLLFLIQPLGLSRLASCFAPIVIVWLGFNGGFGIYNLVKFDHSVLKAFNPYYAFQFFIQNKTEGWKMLGGILLAFTGVEALFADLGAFSMRAIQLSWLCYTYPCLLLAYISQAAYISVHPDAYSNPFYNSVPPGMLYPSLIIAVLAAIVASQAMITATFQVCPSMANPSHRCKDYVIDEKHLQLISQIMKLSYCPQVKVVHTSKTFHGQLYVPFLNWLLMILAVLVTAVYSNTTRLGNAYGVCVMFVTFFDTCMVTLVALVVWRVRPYLVVLPWLVFACFDGLYLSSALNKVPDGAWFTLTISGILTCFFLLWRFGKETQWSAEAEDRFRLNSLVAKDDEGRLRLTARWGGDQLSQVRGLGIFFDKTGAMTPSVFTHFASKFCATMDVTVFFHLHPVEAPTVPDGERYSVSRFTAIPGCYRLVVTHGFMDEVISPDLAALVYEKVRAFVARQAVGARGEEEGVGRGDGASESGSQATQRSGIENVERSGLPTPGSESPAGSTGADVSSSSGTAATRGRRHAGEKLPAELRDGAVAAELARLDRAYAARIMYVVGKEQMKIRDQTPIFRKVVLGTFLWIRENTRAKIANLRLAMERVVEVGFVKEI